MQAYPIVQGMPDLAVEQEKVLLLITNACPLTDNKTNKSVSRALKWRFILSCNQNNPKLQIELLAP